MKNVTINSSVFDDINLEEQDRPMETGKAKGWLGEYHWVSLAKKVNEDDKSNQAVSWCEENLGKSGSRWFEKDSKFYFKDEKDMSMFILRWS